MNLSKLLGIGRRRGASQPASGGTSDRKGPSELSPLAAFAAGASTSLIPSDLRFPDREGIAHTPALILMEGNREMIELSRRSFTGVSVLESFDDQLLRLIHLFALQVGTLPASRNYHHSNRGGLFAHSLAVALSSLHTSAGKNVIYDSAPRDREAHALAWQLVAFICGLLHDVGKVHTIGRVQAMTLKPQPSSGGGFISQAAPRYDTIWEPTVESFEAWAEKNAVESYFIDWTDKPTRQHAGYVERYVRSIIPSPLLAFVYKSSPTVVRMFEDFIRNPDSSAATPLFKIVRDADHVNVTESLDPKRMPGSITLTALLWRRLTEFAQEQSWNLPSSPFIRAHVRVGSSNRYLQIPFFVASPSNIEAFLGFIFERDMFGVSIHSDKAEQIVFSNLESASHLLRTIPGVLPEQIASVEDSDLFIPDHVPASLAHVLFSPRQTEATMTGGPTSDTPVLVELPVIALGGLISTARTAFMPTLSFWEEPTEAMAESLPVAVIAGELKPEDPAQESDPEVVEKLRQVSAAYDMTMADVQRVAGLGGGQVVGRHAAAELQRIKAQTPQRQRQGRDRDAQFALRLLEPTDGGLEQQVSAGAGGGAGARTPPLAAARPGGADPAPKVPAGRRSKRKAAGTAPPGTSGEVPPIAPEPPMGSASPSQAHQSQGVPSLAASASSGVVVGLQSDVPAESPLWCRYYGSAEADWPALLCAIWCYSKFEPKHAGKALITPRGYGLTLAALSADMRKEFVAAIQASGLKVKRVSDLWPVDGIRKPDAVLGAHVEDVGGSKLKFRIEAQDMLSWLVPLPEDEAPQ